GNELNTMTEIMEMFRPACTLPEGACGTPRPLLRKQLAGVWAEEKWPRDLLQCLRDLKDQWLRLSIAAKEKILDMLLLEQFLVDSRKWVRYHCPKSFREALQLAEHFDTAQEEMRCF
uniref:SCAN box domain-containing protein n=1 Tax=Crocodylus porosus TaxID=8502 RepID=A0A7M4F8L1_CROPO